MATKPPTRPPMVPVLKPSGEGLPEAPTEKMPSSGETLQEIADTLAVVAAALPEAKGPSRRVLERCVRQLEGET